MTDSLQRRTVITARVAMPFVSTHAREALPEIPPIPEKLKDWKLRIATFDGFMQQT